MSEDSLFAATSTAIQQRVAEFFYELDVRNGVGVGDFYTEDGVFLVAGNTFSGREAVVRFYVANSEKVKAEQKDGVRTARHLVLNPAVLLQKAGHAEFRFVVLYFSGEGKPPLFDATLPSIVADCQMDFRCEADGMWRIAKFDSQPIFVGGDPFMKKAVLK